MVLISEIIKIAIGLCLLFSYIAELQSVTVDVYTEPKELGFRIYSKDNSFTTEMFMIQPKMWGSLIAQIGPFSSEHLFKMPSVSIHLNTHIVQMYRNHITPLYALCTVENPQLILQPNIIIVCTFQVIIPSIPSGSFENSSCIIQFNEFECVASINLEFLPLQLSMSSFSQITIHITQNVTAYEANRSSGLLRLSELPDLTGSLILLASKIQPVTVLMLMEYLWNPLLLDSSGKSILFVGLPYFRKKHTFSLLVGIDPYCGLQAFDFKLLLGSNLRYYYQEQTPGSRSWHFQATSQPYGALVRARKLNTEQDPADSDLLVIGDLIIEEIALGGEHSTAHSAAWPSKDHVSENERGFADFSSYDEDDAASDKDNNRNLPITLRLLRVTPGNVSGSLSLRIPSRLPKPDAVHIFVQFEPRDILEPPWFPAVPSPEPYKLRVLSLTPTATSSTSPNPLESIFGRPTAGRLMEITDHVFCRPIATRSNSIETPTTTSSNTVCPTVMPRAPPEVEEFLPDSLLAGRTGFTDQLVLALPGSTGTPDNGGGSHSHIVPTIYGTIQSSTGEITWAWREVCGPTVRRWMMEGFRIHVDSTNLRKIHGWKIATSSVYDNRLEVRNLQGIDNSTGIIDRFEQTAITVTARIYMMRPGTGQRTYLGRSDSWSDLSVEPYPSASGSDEPIHFDVTRMLPSWALVVRPVLNRQDEVVDVPAAYVHRDAFTGRPYLVGRWPGRVVLGLVATSGDSQPLATVYVNVGQTGELEDRSNSLFVASMRAECVDPALRLSGQLTPADLTNGDDVSEGITSRRSDTSVESSSSVKSPSDIVLPTPQRLKINLQRIAAVTGDIGLITAASSSASHGFGYLQSLYQKSFGQMARSATNSEIQPSSSAASCPIHLLAVSLILSDGSMIPTHTIPPGQLRLSSFDSNIVWDPAIPVFMDQFDKIKKRQETSTHAKQSTKRVLVNKLVVWSPRLKNLRGVPVKDVTPIGMMDDVLAAIHSGFQLRDPGPPWSSSQLTVEEKIPLSDQTGIDKQPSRNTSEHRPRSALDDRVDVFFASHARVESNHPSRTASDARSGRQTILVTHVLVAIGCIAIFLLAINGIVLFALRKRRRSNAGGPSTGPKNQLKAGGFEPFLVSSNGCCPHANMTPTMGSYVSGYQGEQRLANNVHPSDIVPMATGLSMSSVGSGNSGHLGSLKQPIILENVGNPYFINSDPSSSSFIHSPPNSHVPSHSLMESPNWPAVSAGVHFKQYSRMNPHAFGAACDGWNVRLSPTSHRPHNGGYTSGLGSVGTAEGCSDEGVASNFEMISLSQDLNYPNVMAHQRMINGAPVSGGGGASSTTSGGSGGCHNFANQNRTLFKRSPTSGIGAGSLSGGSSAGELSDYRAGKRPDTIGILEHSSPERGFAQRPSNSPCGRRQVSPKNSNLFASSDNSAYSPMCDSFTRDPSANHTLLSFQRNSPALKREARRKSPDCHENSLNVPSWNLPLPSLTTSNYNPVNDTYPDCAENSPVPFPPTLLLNKRMCMDSLPAHCRPNFTPTLHRDIANCDGRTSYKRSDSFGMATKAHGPVEVAVLPIINKICQPKEPTNEMVGDTMDFSDEVSSESRSSSAWRKASLSPAPAVKASELDYNHQIPPPEV